MCTLQCITMNCLSPAQLNVLAIALFKYLKAKKISYISRALPGSPSTSHIKHFCCILSIYIEK